MKKYNLDGLPGLTIFGKPGEDGQRGCMTFYSSNISQVNIDDFSSQNIKAQSIAICDNDTFLFYTDGIKPIINDIIISNINGIISKYIIYDIIKFDNIDESSKTKIKSQYKNPIYVYFVLFENSNKIRTNSTNDVDFSLSISSSFEKAKTWPGFYTIDYLNKKSTYNYKYYLYLGFNYTDFVYYDDNGKPHLPPRRIPVMSNNDIKQNFIDLYKDRFNCITNENVNSDNYKLLVKSKEYDESLFVYKQLKTDEPIIIKLKLLNAFNGKPITNAECSKVVINCDVTNLYDTTFGLHGIDIKKFNISNGNTYDVLHQNAIVTGNYIKPFGYQIDPQIPIEDPKANDIASINTITASNVVSDDNGYITVTLDIDKVLNTTNFHPDSFISFSYVVITCENNRSNDHSNDKFISGTFLLNSLNEIKDIKDIKGTNVFGFECYVMPGNLGSFKKTDGKIDNDAISAKYDRISEVSLTNNTNNYLNTFTYDYGDLPFFRTDTPSLIDYNDSSIELNDNDSSIDSLSKLSKLYKPILEKDDDNNVIKVDLPIFELGSAKKYESSLNHKQNDSSVAVMTFKLTSGLSDSELDKYKIVAEFVNNDTNIFKLSTSTCMNKLWIDKNNEDNIIHPFGDADIISNKLNFNNENIFPCSIIIKNFTDKFSDESLTSKIKMPFELIKTCKINVYAYYKETPSKIIKIYLGNTTATETFE